MIAQPAFTAMELLADLRIGTARQAVAAAVLNVPGRDDAAMPATMPFWLWPEHHALVAALVAALRRHGGALLAAPTGTGKSYVALAAALACRDADAPATVAVVICPAALRRQWSTLGRSLGVAIAVRTHESLSRSAMALPDAALVIVDESHRFREPATRKHTALADLLVGRRALLCTATPLVNRLDDLVHQLALVLPDDALAREGLPSLRRQILSGAGHLALDRIITAPPRAASNGPPVRRRRQRTSMTPTLAEVVVRIEALGWSRDEAVARLLRGVVWRALASSPAAALAVLRRHARLLAHARDAAAAGRRVTRGDVVAWTAHLDDQLLLWAVLPDSQGDADLVLEDAELLRAAAEALRFCESDGAVTSVLAAVAADACPTIVFASLRATAASLVRALGPRTAWCTGDAAGIGHTRLPREAVLGHFRTEAVLPGAPHLLVATDVAAEGLDLPRLRRVIHADLPWTPARLAQREGRARRAASRATEVEVIVCLPPVLLAERAGIEAHLAAKRLLGARAGLDALRDAWHARERLRRRCAGAVPLDGIFARLQLPGMTPRALVALDDETGGRSLLLVHADGKVVEDPVALAEMIECALAESPSPSHAERVQEACAHRTATTAIRPDADALQSCDRLLAAVRDELRRRLALRHGGDWLLDARSSGAIPLVLRLQTLAAAAARDRHLGRLRRIDAWLRWAARGHATGERRLAAALADLSDDALAQRVDRDAPPAARAAAGSAVPRLTLRALLLMHP